MASAILGWSRAHLLRLPGRVPQELLRYAIRALMEPVVPETFERPPFGSIRNPLTVALIGAVWQAAPRTVRLVPGRNRA